MTRPEREESETQYYDCSPQWLLSQHCTLHHCRLIKQPDTIIISERQVSLKWRTGQSWLESQLPDINPNFLSGVGAEQSLTSLECLQAKPVPVAPGRDTPVLTAYIPS